MLWSIEYRSRSSLMTRPRPRFGPRFRGTWSRLHASEALTHGWHGSWPSQRIPGLSVCVAGRYTQRIQRVNKTHFSSGNGHRRCAWTVGWSRPGQTRRNRWCRAWLWRQPAARAAVVAAGATAASRRYHRLRSSSWSRQPHVSLLWAARHQDRARCDPTPMRGCGEMERKKLCRCLVCCLVCYLFTRRGSWGGERWTSTGLGGSVEEQAKYGAQGEIVED